MAMVPNMDTMVPDSGALSSIFPGLLPSNPSGITISGGGASGSSLSGTATAASDGVISPINIYFNSDTVNAGATGLNGLSVLLGASAGLVGNRNALQGYIAAVGAPASGSVDYTGVAGIARVSTNLGGTSGAYGNYLGGVFGANANVFTNSAATFLSEICAEEFDVTLAAGASAAEKHGITIIQGSNDAVRATYDDAAVEFAAQDGTTTTWTTGIMFGAYAHKWSFGSDSTLIGAQVRQTGPASSSIANLGIDFSNVTFTTGFLKSTGFSVDKTGAIITSGSTNAGALTAGQAGLSGINLSLDTAGASIFIGRAVVINTGDNLASSTNGAGRVGWTSYNSNNGTTAQNSLILGNSNSVSQASITLNGGSFSGGQGASALAISNTSTAPIVIGTGTEVIKFGTSGAFTANGAVATALSSVGPTGANTTVQEWLTIKDSSGTTRYIPCF